MESIGDHNFTSLYPDLVMARNMNCDGQNRKFLTDLVLDSVFDANFNAKYVMKLKKRKEGTTIQLAINLLIKVERLQCYNVVDFKLHYRGSILAAWCF